MAIKITKPGQKEFHAFCTWCGCEFTYEISDLKLSGTSDKVSCPTCGKDYYHPSLVQAPTLQTVVDYQWPSDATDPCTSCEWKRSLKQNDLYIGDNPCTWCNKNKFTNVTDVTDVQPSLETYKTPCTKQLDAHLTTSTSTKLTSTDKYTTAYSNTENKKDITQGTVMQTILNACNTSNRSDTCNCDDTDDHNSCSSKHTCSGKKNYKGKQ